MKRNNIDKKVSRVLVRFYDSSNLGDDLFLKILAERYPNTIFEVPVYGAKKIPVSNHNMRGVRVPLPRKLLIIVGTVIGIANPQLLLLSKLRPYRCMVYIGGSIFIESKYMKKWISETRFYKYISLPYYIVGANIGPYRSQDFLTYVKKIFSKANDVCLRDSQSYNLVRNMNNTRLSTDIAFSLDTKPYVVEQKKLAILSIIDGYRKFDDATTVKYEAELRKMTARLVADGYKVVYMSFCKGEGDESAIARVRKCLPGEVEQEVVAYNYSSNLEEALSLIASSEIMIGSRFHAVILALVFGKKVLPMAYSDKTTDILSDIGFAGDVIDIRNINTINTDHINFDNLTVNKVMRQKQAAELQFQGLDKILRLDR